MAKLLGEVFGVWEHLGGPQPKKGLHVELTAGLTGSGDYNEGLLSSESVSGTAPLVTATAQIAAGPLTGQTIRLINTERRVLRAGSSGTVENDQMEEHQHSVSVSGLTGTRQMAAVGSGNREAANAAPFVAVTTATSVRGGTETRTKNVGVVYYLRIVP